MRHRQGFTLVEMLVATAVAFLIMAILSEAFVIGLESLRQVKAIGELSSRLHTATTILRRDLSADHFEGRRRLSDPAFWTQGAPREGFFRIYQGSPSTQEGADGWGIPSFRAVDHRLHMMMRLRSNGSADFFSTTLPTGSPLFRQPSDFFGQPADARYQDTPGVYRGALAEVAYYLVANGDFAGTTPLYDLRRAQFVVIADNTNLN